MLIRLVGPEIPIATGRKRPGPGGAGFSGKIPEQSEDDFSRKPEGLTLPRRSGHGNTFACGYGDFRFYLTELFPFIFMISKTSCPVTYDDKGCNRSSAAYILLLFVFCLHQE
ncbi:hypothetical protein [Dysgonomonas reticulitermitis]